MCASQLGIWRTLVVVVATLRISPFIQLSLFHSSRRGILPRSRFGRSIAFMQNVSLLRRGPIRDSTERQNELYSEVWQLFFYSSTELPAMLPCAMLQRRAGELTKKQLTVQCTQPNVRFILSHSTFIRFKTILQGKGYKMK